MDGMGKRRASRMLIAIRRLLGHQDHHAERLALGIRTRSCEETRVGQTRSLSEAHWGKRQAWGTRRPPMIVERMLLTDFHTLNLGKLCFKHELHSQFSGGFGV
jgi:hypothetical protein